MRAIFGILMSAATMMTAGIGEAAAGCNFDRLVYCGGCTIDQTIVVTDDTPCRFASHFTGGVVSTKTLVRAQHGLFARAAVYDYAYQVRPGYKGTDYFEYEVVYNTPSGQPQRVVIRGHVTIK
ncbi:MAG: hypothetical protein P4L82_17620 [Ancalomicrobiaceae bacterium]|nr:hypothetical protein [Ancalomicrobiaceae bacterium]